MTKAIVITLADGSLSVMRFTSGRDVTDAMAPIEIARAGITAVSYRVVDIAAFPADRVDRDAWQDNGTAVAVSVPRKTALADLAKNQKVDALQSGALVALATAVFQIIKGTMAISQASLTAAQFRAYLKSLLP